MMSVAMAREDGFDPELQRLGDPPDREKAKATLPKGLISTFTTYFTGGRGSPRSQNIITIAKEVDGAVAAARAQFTPDAVG